MLVKFGKMGKTITEYLLKDEATLEDLLDAANEELEDDDSIHELYDDSKRTLDLDSEEPLKANTTYILETIELTSQEEKICQILDDEWDPDDSITCKKAIIKKILSCGWDK